MWMVSCHNSFFGDFLCLLMICWYYFCDFWYYLVCFFVFSLSFKRNHLVAFGIFLKYILVIFGSSVKCATTSSPQQPPPGDHPPRQTWWSSCRCSVPLVSIDDKWSNDWEGRDTESHQIVHLKTAVLARSSASLMGPPGSMRSQQRHTASSPDKDPPVQEPAHTDHACFQHIQEFFHWWATTKPWKIITVY